MPSAQILRTVALVSFVLAGLLLVVAGLLFWRLSIPKAIGYLSGRTRRREIERIRQKNAELGQNGTKRTTAEIGPVKDPTATLSQMVLPKGAAPRRVLVSPAIFDVTSGKFRIEEEIMFLHTEERVP